MVAKHLIQIIITGVQVVGKAFGQAVRQEIRMSQEAAKRSQSRSKFLLHSRKRLDNVLRIGSNRAIFYSHNCISVLFLERSVILVAFLSNVYILVLVGLVHTF